MHGCERLLHFAHGFVVFGVVLSGGWVERVGEDFCGGGDGLDGGWSGLVGRLLLGLGAFLVVASLTRRVVICGGDLQCQVVLAGDGFVASVAAFDVGGGDAGHVGVAHVPDEAVEAFVFGKGRWGGRASGVFFEVFVLPAGEGVDGFAGGVGDLQFDVLVLVQLRQVVVDDDAVGRVDSAE